MQGRPNQVTMTPQGINISYNQSGDITFTVTWHPASIADALEAVNGFISRLDGEPKKQKAQPKPKKTVPTNDKRGRHLWTDDEKQEAAQRYAAGEDLKIIAEAYGSTPGSVMKIMKAMGVKRPWPTKGNPSKLQPVEEPKEEPV